MTCTEQGLGCGAGTGRWSATTARSAQIDYGTEVCASTPTGDLEPCSSDYEGYMGNWGNTLDRWYHRAAVVVWPRDQAFANRAETSPGWALDEVAAMASAGDVPGARAVLGWGAARPDAGGHGPGLRAVRQGAAGGGRRG